MEKTGSTSIQRWLCDQREVLNREGWYVPSRLGKLNHRVLSLLAFDSDRRDDATRRRNIITNDHLLELQKKIKARLKSDVKDALKKNCHTIFASSELISSRLTKFSEKKRLICELIDSGVRQVAIVLVVRDAADLAESRHSTAILFEGRVDAHPPMPYTEEADLFGNQIKLIKDWREVLDDQPIDTQIFVLDYEKSLNEEGSICSYLAKKLHMSETLCKAGINAFENKSLPVFTLHLLRISNYLTEKIQLKINCSWINSAANLAGFILKNIALKIQPGSKRYKMPLNLKRMYRKAYQKPSVINDDCIT